MQTIRSSSIRGLSPKGSKWFIFIVVLLGIIAATAYITSNYKTEYRVLLRNNQELGIVSSPQTIQAWMQQKILAYKSKHPGVNFETNEEEMSIVPIKTWFGKAEDEKTILELEQFFTIQSKGVLVEIDNKPIGVVRSKQEANLILTQYKNRYLPVKNNSRVTALSYSASPVNAASVKTTEFVESITMEEIVIDSQYFLTTKAMMKKLEESEEKKVTYTVRSGDCVSCIAQKFNVPLKVIYDNNPWIQDDLITIGDVLNLSVQQPILSVKTEEEVSETLEIPQGTEVNYDESLRSEVTKVLSNGSPGTKKVTYLVTRINGEIVEEKAIKATILKKAVPKRIVQGTKVVKGIGTGSFAWPITSPEITSHFGKRWGRLHAGTDTVSQDRSIYASDHGKVEYAGYDSGYGNHIIINHGNGYRTLYAHLSKISVKEAQVVEKGEEIGVMGTTGRSTGVHLHFEVRKNGQQLNPLKFLE
ncbi:LysM peptidoglycan-binding domain-containing M23 family metallopeptidase [Paenibacillus sp. B01]|uniref:LysM peptidoglycan-binding domain-containing M23 family metallopeptidase n=1 Tax=Paenibacillus sp. B01 TaxID=2660554 RepID=UPI0018917450|nr:peptidoglycan DD-metalloendopeptidase family protein [Paenibacillus sp. B01]